MDSAEPGYRIRLISVASYYNAPGSDEFEQVIFTVTPTLTESRRVDYNPVSPIHMPGSIQIYKNTSSRDFRVSAKLISRTPTEALENMRRLQLLRGWTQPYFGNSSTLTSDQVQARRDVDPNASANQRALQRVNEGVELLGAPPDVLYLCAYSSNNQRADSTDQQRQTTTQAVNIHKLPVVITSLDITYPEDVDYIPSSDSVPSPFPTKMDVEISLSETHSPAEYQKFNLADFKRGRLVNF